MGKYLDSLGLDHLIGLIKTALSGKQTVGDWIDIHDGNINYGGSAPSSAHWDRVLEIFDANGKGIGYIQSSHATSGTVALALGMDSVNGSTQNQIFLGWRQNGDPTVSVSVPVKWRDALELGTAATHAHEDYALASHTHSYLPLSGGTLSGVLDIEDPGVNANLRFRRTAVDTSKSDNGVSQTNWSNFGFYDVDDRYYGYVQAGAYATGATRIEMFARNLVNGSNVNNGIQLTVAKDGTRSVTVSDDAAWRTALGLGAVATYENGSALINSLGTGSSTPVDADYYVCQYAGGGTSNTTYVRRPMSSLWNYIKSKIDSVYGIGTTAKGAGQSELASAKAATSVATATTVNLDTVVLAPGTWLVTYSAEFASNATGRRVMTLTTNATSITSTPVYMMSTAAANGLATNLSRSQVIVNSGTSNVTRYLNVYQNSGSALNCRSCIQAVRIA